MRQTINTIIHSVGYLFFMVGFIMMVKAAGDADLVGTMDSIMRYSVAGITACVGGLFLTWWRV